MPTSETLTLPGFEPMASTESTPSAAASPVRMSASRARVPAWTVSDPACGESFAVSLASFDPVLSTWKTSGLYEAEDSCEFSQTLPRSGMTRSGTLYLLPPLVRLTSVIVSGSSQFLPTPRAADHDSGPWRPAGRGPNLLGAISQTPLALLSTPTATMGERGGRGDLIQQLRGNQSPSGHYKPMLLPTPQAYGKGNSKSAPGLTPLDIALRPEMAQHAIRAKDRRKGIPLAQTKRSLDQWVGDSLLPTPQAQDFRNCADYSDGSRGKSPQLRHLGSGRLNPRFVEWMMGYPPGWTDLNELDTPS